MTGLSRPAAGGQQGVRSVRRAEGVALRPRHGLDSAVPTKQILASRLSPVAPCSANALPSRAAGRGDECAAASARDPPLRPPSGSDASIEA
ncbi:hypothetical protein CDD83_3179 [Cordyceps sp. RAO-2017]|nr:hypothetical protein CDD83_3179 [Cordyceps sp. RAO-2017]